MLNEPSVWKRLFQGESDIEATINGKPVVVSADHIESSTPKRLDISAWFSDGRVVIHGVTKKKAGKIDLRSR